MLYDPKVASIRNANAQKRVDEMMFHFSRNGCCITKEEMAVAVKFEELAILIKSSLSPQTNLEKALAGLLEARRTTLGLFDL